VSGVQNPFHVPQLRSEVAEVGKPHWIKEIVRTSLAISLDEIGTLGIAKTASAFRIERQGSTGLIEIIKGTSEITSVVDQNDGCLENRRG